MSLQSRLYIPNEMLLAPGTDKCRKAMLVKLACLQLTFMKGLVALRAPEDRQGLALDRCVHFRLGK